MARIQGTGEVDHTGGKTLKDYLGIDATPYALTVARVRCMCAPAPSPSRSLWLSGSPLGTPREGPLTSGFKGLNDRSYGGPTSIPPLIEVLGLLDLHTRSFLGIKMRLL